MPGKETLRDAKGDITANMEAAKIKARRCIWRHNEWTSDPYLRRIMPILLERTERLRLGLLNQDSSCSPGINRMLSTESEVPKNHSL
ncbi:hypothetical protein [Rhabdochromatium marinum]|uniref:hypothetical protein n=1 Tax=Rhabdochromatium marinum TaxID=48729 RepID=UPI001F5B35F8|nr:hypothetical protein [Rhabdochromatium marinum]